MAYYYRWNQQALSARLHPDLQYLLSMYLQHGHPVLCADGSQHVFLTNKGMPMAEATTITNYWYKMIKRLGFTATFPPHRLRHIFVAERRSHDRADGPEDHQAAMAMGNTEAAWDSFYDRMYQSREMQAGVDAMAVWRASMLEKAKTSRICADAEQAEANATNNDSDNCIVLGDSGDEA